MVNGGSTDAGTIVFTDQATAGYAAGDRINISLGENSVSYTITAEDIASTTIEDVLAVKVKDAIEASGADVTVDYDSGTGGTLTVTNDGANSLQISGQFTSVGSGGLAALDAIDVSNQAGAQAALETIETLIDRAVDAAASFGSDQKRIDTQAEFVTNLTDSLTTGDRQPCRCRHGRNLGAFAGFAGATAVGHAVLVDCEPAAAEHPVAIPLKTPVMGPDNGAHALIDERGSQPRRKDLWCLTGARRIASRQTPFLTFLHHVATPLPGEPR